MYDTNEVLRWQHQTFYICKPYLFSHIYDPVSIACSGVIFTLCNAYEVLLQLIKISHLGAIFLLSHVWPIMESMFDRHISFSLFMPISFDIVNTYVYIQNTNAHEVWGDSLKYFKFVSHIFSFIIYNILSISCLPTIFIFLHIPMCFIEIYTHFSLPSIFVLNVRVLYYGNVT